MPRRTSSDQRDKLLFFLFILYTPYFSLRQKEFSAACYNDWSNLMYTTAVLGTETLCKEDALGSGKSNALFSGCILRLQASFILDKMIGCI